MENGTFPKYEAADRLFAVVYLALGYGFIHMFTSSTSDWSLVIFTLAYVTAVLVYLGAKNCAPAKESWFWLGVMLAMVLPLPFWSVMYLLQILALMAVAAYWTLCASGRLLNRVTSQWVFFDGWNALFMVPIGNFLCQIRVLFGCRLCRSRHEPSCHA